MKIDFSQALYGLNGEQLQENGAPVTLGSVVVNALLLPDEESQKLQGTEKAERYQLAMRIHGAGELDVSVEQVATIKSLVGRLFVPLVVGQVWPMLESQPSLVQQRKE